MGVSLIPNKKLRWARTETAVSAPPREPSLRPFDFGWYWEVTEDVSFVTDEMIRLGRLINVWDTPQFKAIERLIGAKKMNFPARIDTALHGVFLRIMAIEIICKSAPLTGDLKEAITRCERAAEHLCEAADQMHQITDEVIDYFECLPPSLPISLDDINTAQNTFAVQLGLMKGVLETQLRFQKRISEDFLGKPLAEKQGRPRNWVSEFVAKIAADIYRTSFPGFIVRQHETRNRSFHTFLDEFCEGIPDAMRADTRKLARHVWEGGYRGTSFAPIAEK